MRKLYTLLACLILVTTSSYAQIAYYDALKLKELTTRRQMDGSLLFAITDSSKYNSILKLYSPSSKSYFELYLAYQNNPFIKIPAAANQSSAQAKSVSAASLTKLGKSVGAIDVTTYAQGVSLFLIDRAKEELTVAFFQKFIDFTNKYPEIETLFPHTTNILGNLLAYQYAQMLPVLQDAFYKDLNQLPDNIYEVLMMDKYYNKVENIPIIFVVLNTLDLLKQITFLPPPEVIDQLPNLVKNKKDNSILPGCQDVYYSMVLTTILSNSIRTSDQEFVQAKHNYWIQPKQFWDSILSDSLAWKIFLGLIYQTIKESNCQFNGTPLVNHIKSNNQEISWYHLQYAKLLDQTEQVVKILNEIKEMDDAKQKPSKEQFHSYLSSTINLFSFGYDIASHYKPGLKKSDDFVFVANKTNDLFLNTMNQKYSLAINNALQIFQTISRTIKEKGLWGDVEEDRKDAKFLSFLGTYGTFMANMADADTPEEVKAAINNAALPVGSSSYKKNFQNNLALNAYLGVNYGNWNTFTESPSETWTNTFRLTAPIGVAWTPCAWKNAGSLSLFASILDVGAIVDYQLNKGDKDTTVTQKIYLSNIFSPGGYIVYGMAWNLPISIGIGGQYGPGIIKMGDKVWEPTWRWNIFLAVDIPIFNLSKGKGKAKNK